MHDVFVSYATPDRQVAEAIVHHLESIGIRCFYAPRNMRSGVPWPGQLVEGIKAAKLIVLVLSHHSNISEPVRKEIFQAVKSGLKLIPFKMEAVDLHPDLEFHLEGQHWLDALNPPLAARIQELGVDLCLLLKRDPAPVFEPPEVETEPKVVHHPRRPNTENGPNWKRWGLIGSACLVAFALWPKTPKVITKAVPVVDPATQTKRDGVVQKVKDVEHAAADAHKPAQPSPKPEIVKQPTPFERVTTTGNSLGMKFVHFSDLPAAKILGCIHETRSKDFAAFIADKNRGYEMTGDGAGDWRNYEHKGVPVGRGKDEKADDSDHPVCNVIFEDAQAFCQWLTTKERSHGLIGPKDEYRLPSDAEWSLMVGLGEEKGSTPAEKSKNGDTTHYPWGGAYPPTSKAGNYSDETATKSFGANWSTILFYTDGFATTAPVMSFAPNSKGFYDLGGNAYEWCEGWYNKKNEFRVLRGASWLLNDESRLLSSVRSVGPSIRGSDFGFRCVLVVVSGG